MLTLNGANYTIAGVLPGEFVFPIRGAELAVPIVEAEARRVEGNVAFLRLVARLRPDVSRARAEPLMTAVAHELQRLRPDANARKVAIRLTPLHEQIVGDYAVTLRLLLGAVAARPGPGLRGTWPACGWREPRIGTASWRCGPRSVSGDTARRRSF